MQSARQMPYREQDIFLPIANVARIMKNSIPPNGKIAKEAKECANALDDILSKLPYRPSFFASDAGNEFNPKELW